MFELDARHTAAKRPRSRPQLQSIIRINLPSAYWRGASRRRRFGPHSGGRRRLAGRSGRPRRCIRAATSSVRSAAFGQRSTIDCMWLCVMARIRSAWRTNCSVSGWASCRDRSRPCSRITCTASDVGGQPGAAAMPAEMTDTPRVLQLVQRALQALGQTLAHQQLGHRAAARVAGANEQHHDARQPPQRRFADDALAQNLELIVLDAHDRRRLPVAARTVVEHHGHVAVEASHDFLGGDRVGARRCGWRW